MSEPIINARGFATVSLCGQILLKAVGAEIPMADRHAERPMPTERTTGASSCRLDDLIRFYSILETLENRLGGRRMLADCHGRKAR